MSQKAAEGIANFMHAHSQGPAFGAAAQGVFGELASLMDVGCGSGVYGIEIARSHPRLKVVLMDLKEMATEAQKFIDRAGMGRQVTIAGVNMFTEKWPRGHDGHFFSNVFHDWSDETCRLLAQKSFEALPNGGRIFLNEILMDDDCTGPFPAAAFSLLMLVGTLGQAIQPWRIPRHPWQRRLRRRRGRTYRRRLLLASQCPQALSRANRGPRILSATGSSTPNRSNNRMVFIAARTACQLPAWARDPTPGAIASIAAAPVPCVFKVTAR